MKINDGIEFFPLVLKRY